MQPLRREALTSCDGFGVSEKIAWLTMTNLGLPVVPDVA